MDWNVLLRLPSTVLLLLAALALLWALWHLLKGWRRLRRRRRVAAGWHGLILLVALALALLFAGLGSMLHGYRFLDQEQRVMQVAAHQLGPRHWRLNLVPAQGPPRTVELHGDDFRVEAVVLKWKLPAVLSGLPPLYRLDRLEGRYEDVALERERPRSVIDMRAPAGLDLFGLEGRYPHWLLQVDTIYGSGVYMPLVDEGHYTVSLMRTGALVLRADAATAGRIGRSF